MEYKSHLAKLSEIRKIFENTEEIIRNEVNNWYDDILALRGEAIKEEIMIRKEKSYIGKIVEIKTTELWDSFHTIKRIGSLMWFDAMLECCQQSQCPSKIMSPTILYALSDISLEEYINQMSSEILEQETKNDFVKKRVDFVLNCKKYPDISTTIFDIDTEEIFKRTNTNGITYNGTRQRRSYWIFLKNYHSWRACNDYLTVCEFISQVHSITTKKLCTHNDLEKIKSIIRKNYHISNPLDLYRVCLVRKKINNESASPTSNPA